MNFIASPFASRCRIALLAGAAVVAFPTIASAQDQADSNSANASQAQSQDDTSAIGNEIIVTATKRAQTLQDVPVAVSVTTADTIERAQIRDVSDLTSVVPSLSASQSQSQFATTYSIRGFGTSGNNIGLEPSVAVYVDGVYRSRAIAQIGDLPDIQRIEVLRGPQSALFGKNASAGVISIVTKAPSFTPHGSVEASYGNYNDVVAKAYLTGPISDTVAASIAGGYHRRDGYLTNAYNGDDMNNRNRWFARGQVLFEPSSDFSFRLIADYDRIDEKCCGVVNLRPSAATLAIQALGGMVNDYRTPFADVVYSDVVPTSKVENWGVSGQADYTMNSLKLTSITAYRQSSLNADQDVDFTSAKLATGANIGQAKIKTFTQELRLASDFDGPVNFLLGGYFFDENVDDHDQIVYGSDFRNYVDLLIRGLTANTQSADSIEATFGAPPNTFWQAGQGFFNNMKQHDQAWSVFGNVDIQPIDNLTLTLGINYTHDAKDVTTNSYSTDLFSAVDIPGAISQINAYYTALTVGQYLSLPAGTLASPAQIAYFQSVSPTGYNAIVQGVSAQTAPLMGFQALQFLPPFQNIPNAVEDGRTRDGNVSYIARLAYEFNPHLNAYISYSSGFKASSWNLSRDSRPSPAAYAALVNQGLAVTNLVPGSRFADPEIAENYELGIKGNWGLASANLTFFKQSIRNFQTNTFTGTGFILANAGKQSTFGVEFDGMARPTDELTLEVAVTYLDPKYDSFVASPFGDLSGTEIGNISKFVANFGATWDQPIGDDHLILRGNFRYAAPVQVEPGLLAFITTNTNGTPNYDTARAAARPFRREDDDLNASLTYSFANGLDLMVWGRNLLDHRSITDIFDSVAQSQSISGYVNQPRTYGVSARFKF
ncbi:TonB-dependent receptor [Tsuneonella mangrovi]|uniref:TonB-dependent receptor n=1 Tax=Tsuneonella mangrovi TaxID=1982042 RepID=UPI000BA28AD8|nr:TonB-dependent receptor [Tsuneonella mangrovi]